MFHFLSNLVNILMIFKKVLLDDFYLMLLSSFNSTSDVFIIKELRTKSSLVIVGVSEVFDQNGEGCLRMTKVDIFALRNLKGLLIHHEKYGTLSINLNKTIE